METTLKKEVSVIDQLRQMDVGQTLEFPAGRSPYLRNLVSQRLINERLDGQAWTVNLDMEKGVTIVTRTAARERQAIENRLLANILAVTSTMTIGKTKAARIVGGRGKLERLHRSGKVTCQDKVNAQNGKWRYNLSEILMHCKPLKSNKTGTTQVKQ